MQQSVSGKARAGNGFFHDGTGYDSLMAEPERRMRRGGSRLVERPPACRHLTKTPGGSLTLWEMLEENLLQEPVNVNLQEIHVAL